MARIRDRSCQRCGKNYRGTSRYPGVWCKSCEAETEGQVLYALMWEDHSGIYGLYESSVSAQHEAVTDATACGVSRLILHRVEGQAGARSLLRESDDDDGWRRREDAWDRADYEQEVGQR